MWYIYLLLHWFYQFKSGLGSNDVELYRLYLFFTIYKHQGSFACCKPNSFQLISVFFDDRIINYNESEHDYS